MKIFNKSTISLALAVAMFGGVVVSEQVSAAPTSTADLASGIPGQTSGDLLLFPYYTTRNGFKTQISITNSSNVDTTIAKVRLRDYKNSDDVLDFTVILSPNDVFAGTISEITINGDDKRVVFIRSPDDTTCTSPRSATSRRFLQGGTESTKNEFGDAGHIEVITMATINADELAAAAAVGSFPALSAIIANSTHSGSTGDTPATTGGTDPVTGCGLVDSYLDLREETAGSGRWIKTVQEELDNLYAESTNDVDIRSNLFGIYSLFKADGGISAAGRPVTMSGVFDSQSVESLVSPCDEADPGNLAGTVNNTIICAQVPDRGHFTFPHLGHVVGMDVSDAGVPAANVNFFNVFQSRLTSAGMATEWSRNPSNNVQSEMTFTLPTKYVLRDDYPARISTTVADWNNLIRTTSQNVFTGSTYAADEPKWDHVDDIVMGAATYTTTPTDIGTDDGVVNADTMGAGSFINSGTQEGCMSFGRTTFDREEQTFTQTGGGTSVSGGQEAAQTVDKICNESTVLTFGDGNGVTQLLTAPNTLKLPTTDLSQTFGWISVYPRNESDNANLALPMIGYTMASRELAGESNGNFAQILQNVRLSQ